MREIAVARDHMAGTHWLNATRWDLEPSGVLVILADTEHRDRRGGTVTEAKVVATYAPGEWRAVYYTDVLKARPEHLPERGEAQQA